MGFSACGDDIDGMFSEQVCHLQICRLELFFGREKMLNVSNFLIFSYLKSFDDLNLYVRAGNKVGVSLLCFGLSVNDDVSHFYIFSTLHVTDFSETRNKVSWKRR